MAVQCGGRTRRAARAPRAAPCAAPAARRVPFLRFMYGADVHIRVSRRPFLGGDPVRRLQVQGLRSSPLEGAHEWCAYGGAFISFSTPKSQQHVLLLLTAGEVCVSSDWAQTITTVGTPGAGR